MHTLLTSIQHSLFTSVQHSLIQFSLFFGAFLIGGLVLTFLSRWTNNAFQQFLFPSFGMYAFGIVGVPIHEFCHAFFCKVFLHEVKTVKWWDPKAKGGAHGAVTHYYNPYNPYHRVGHFFIGLGPVILAPVFLALCFYFLVPGAKGFAAFTAVSPTVLTRGFFSALFAKSNFNSFGFYLFLYLAIAISSQMELSREDLMQAKNGLLPILLILFLLNLGAHVFKANWHGLALQMGWRALVLCSCVFAFAALLALFNLALCSVLLNLVHKVCGRNTINPFRFS